MNSMEMHNISLLSYVFWHVYKCNFYAFVHCSWNQAVYCTRVFMIYNKQPILLLFDYSIPRRASGNCQSTYCSSRCDDFLNVSLLLFEVYFKTSILNPQLFLQQFKLSFYSKLMETELSEKLEAVLSAFHKLKILEYINYKQGIVRSIKTKGMCSLHSTSWKLRTFFKTMILHSLLEHFEHSS